MNRYPPRGGAHGQRHQGSRDGNAHGQRDQGPRHGDNGQRPQGPRHGNDGPPRPHRPRDRNNEAFAPKTVSRTSGLQDFDHAAFQSLLTNCFSDVKSYNISLVQSDSTHRSIEYLLLTPPNCLDQIIENISTTNEILSLFEKRHLMRYSHFSFGANINCCGVLTKLILHIVPDQFKAALLPGKSRVHHPYLLSLLFPYLVLPPGPIRSSLSFLSGFLLTQHDLSYENVHFLKWACLCYLTISNESQLEKFDAKLDKQHYTQWINTLLQTSLQQQLKNLIHPTASLDPSSLSKTQAGSPDSDLNVFLIPFISFLQKVVAPTKTSFDASLLIPIHTHNSPTLNGIVSPTPQVSFTLSKSLNRSKLVSKGGKDQLPSILIPFHLYPDQAQLEEFFVRPRDYSRVVTLLGGLFDAIADGSQGEFDFGICFQKQIIPSTRALPVNIPVDITKMTALMEKAQLYDIYHPFYANVG